MLGEKILNKQLKIIFVVMGVVVLFGLIGGGYYYWWTGTPEYSITQIKKAIETHNPELGLKYIDTDAIFENLWIDMKTDLMGEALEAEEFEGFGMMLGLQLVEGMKPALKEEFKQGIESWFLPPTEEKLQETVSTEENLEVGIFWQEDLEIKRQDNFAYIESPDNVKIVFTKKEGERYWVISKIEGFIGLPDKETISTSELIEKETKRESTVLPNRLKEKVDVELIGKGFIPSDWQSGIYEDYITIKLRFINKTDKDIRGVQGEIVFYDIFDNEIRRVMISYDDGIPKNGSKIWNGYIVYDSFFEEDRKLRATEIENLKYEWLPDTIIYQDGSRETE